MNINAREADVPMINVDEITPIVKGLMYSKIFYKEDEKERLVASLKYYRVINEVLCDMLEAKESLKEDQEFNTYLLANMFDWYATYVRAYELILQTDKLTKISKKEKEEIRKLVENCKADDDLGVILDKVNML